MNNNNLEIKIINDIDNINLKISSDSSIYTYIKNNSFYENKAVFIEDSLIETDDGLIKISDINPNIHKINGVKINYVSEFKFNEHESILFKKDSLADNVPNGDTYLGIKSSVEYNNSFLDAQLFLVKFFKSKVNKIILKNKLMYYIDLENDSYIKINNLKVKLSEINSDKNSNAIKNDVKDQNDIEDNRKLNEIREGNKLLKLDNKILWNHWINFGKKENKKLEIKITFKNADLKTYIDENKASIESFNNDINIDIKKRAWSHWLNSDEKKKSMNILLDFNDADFERFKDDYKSISNKLSNNNKKIWDYWINIGKHDDKKLHQKITYENANFDKYKYDYPFLFKRLYNQNKNISKKDNNDINKDFINNNNKKDFDLNNKLCSDNNEIKSITDYEDTNIQDLLKNILNDNNYKELLNNLDYS